MESFMHRKARAFLLLVGVLLIATSTYSADLVTSYDSLKQGDMVTDAVRIGRRVVVLPTGEWQLVFRGERPVSSDGLNSLGNVVTLSFQEIVDGRFNRALDIAATSQSSNVNWHDEPCKVQGDSFWIDDRHQGINNQFCIRVGFASGIVDEAQGTAYQSWARDIKNKGIGYSREMPFILVTKYTPYDFLRMRLQFDPAVSGIPNSESSPRHLNAWNPANVGQGSQREKFYSALKTWAPAFASGVARAFDGDASLRGADFGTPNFPPKP
jgi:hypothetical protein